MALERSPKVVAFSGGVGGARFVRGLAAVLPQSSLTVVVNTGDDFEHWGLHVSPDLDTVMYTLAGLSHEERGWGLDGETFGALSLLKRYGEPDWFGIGDRDLATHLTRTRALAGGATLSEVTDRLRRALGVQVPILPMTDSPCPTLVETRDDGVLGFQDWFVRRRSEPAVRAIRSGADPAPAPGVLPALAAADLVLIGPSNPYVSIDPILGRAGVRAALERVPVVAVSPIVGGRAVKGPLARMITELTGQAPSAAAIGRHYGRLLSGLVLESGDESAAIEVPVLPASTIMQDALAAAKLAREALRFAQELGR
jgi:LPPG:FO 2-phospho-L-lactate transferase